MKLKHILAVAFSMITVVGLASMTVMADENAITTEEELKAAIEANDGSDIVLGADIDTTESVVIPSGKSFVLNMAGHTINRGLNSVSDKGSVIVIEKGADIQISSYVEGEPSTKGTITGGYAPYGGGIVNRGTLNLYNVDVINNKTDLSNKVEHRGGGIWTSGELSISDCVIKGNKSNDGGGIFIDKGAKLTLNCVTVTGNESVNHGGGGINNNGTIQMWIPSSGEGCNKIVGNTAKSNGGGIWNGVGAVLKVQGRVIVKDNKSKDQDSNNIYLNTNVALDITDELTSDSVIRLSCSGSDGRVVKGWKEHHPDKDIESIIKMDSGSYVIFDNEIYRAVGYTERRWDSAKKKVVSKHVKLNEVPRELNSLTPESGWYILQNSDKDFIAPLVIQSGKTVNLILKDGVTVKFTNVVVQYGATLNIYGQDNDSGKLIAKGSVKDCAGIGARDGEGNGYINIYGGTIEAAGGQYAAGIGTCDEDEYSGACQDITIYGGNITARGGEDSAGIGGGNEKEAPKITIYGGSIKATGAENGAGIGGGDEAGCSTISIYGGDITAQGGLSGAGIGSGLMEDDLYVGNIRIYGGNVKATGGDRGAGIGSGRANATIDDTASGYILIEGGTVVAKSGSNGAGIGGGYCADCDMTIVINGGNVTAQSTLIHDSLHPSSCGAGIGGGGTEDFLGTVKITGGKVTAEGSGVNIGGVEIFEDRRIGAAGIGGGCEGNFEASARVEISGGEVTATGYFGGAAIGAGSESYGAGTAGGEFEGKVCITGGKVTLRVHEGYNLTPFVGHGLSGDNGKTSGVELGTVEVHFVKNGKAESPVASGFRADKCKSISESNDWSLVIATCEHKDRYFARNADIHTLSCPHCGTFIESEHHHYDKGECTKCHYKEKYYDPKILGMAMKLDGQITMQFYVGLPMARDKYDTCYVTFEGKNMDSNVKYSVPAKMSEKVNNGYIVEVKIISIQMADEIKPTLHFCIDGSGKECTTVSEETYSAEKYINYGLKNYKGHDLEVIKALADYGYYSQKYLSEQNNWKIGEKYSEVKTKAHDEFDWDEVRVASAMYEAEKGIGGKVQNVTYKLVFDNDLTIKVFLTPVKGEVIDTAIVDGKEVKTTKSGDRYYVIIKNIRVVDLTDEHTVQVGDAVTRISPMTYVNGILNNDDATDQAKNNACALYYLAQACK